MSAQSALRFEFTDILPILAELPALDLEAASRARLYWHQHKAESIDHATLADQAAWFAACRGEFPVGSNHPRIILLAADRVEPTTPSETPDLVALITAGEAPICEQAEACDADLRLYELDLAAPQASALSEIDAAKLVIYGMMMVEPAVDLLVVNGFGHGTDAGAERLIEALADSTTPLDHLCQIGGRETAAIFGILLSARMARIPVLLEGWSALAAAMVLHALDKRAVQHLALVTDDAEMLRVAKRTNILTIAEHSNGFGIGAAHTIVQVLKAGAKA